MLTPGYAKYFLKCSANQASKTIDNMIRSEIGRSSLLVSTVVRLELGGLLVNIAERKPQQVVAQDNIRVITNALVITKRIRDLQARRQALVSRQEHLRTQLPDWAVEPLKLIGMTSNEVGGLVDDLASVEAESGLDGIESELNAIDQQIEELENVLVKTRSHSLDELVTVMDLVTTRFREIFVTDPNDVFYDHGEARLLWLIERVHDDLTDLVQTSHQNAG
jgi:hypothetical protein